MRATIIAVLVLAVLAPAANAESRLASYRTPGCAGSPIWKIGYRLYWIDSRGRAASKAGYAALLDHAQRFVDKIGPAAKCAVRVQMDLYDEGVKPWPATKIWTRYPPDTPAFQERHG